MFSNNIFLCDINSGELIRKFSGNTGFDTLCIHPDGSKLYVATKGGRILILNTEDLRVETSSLVETFPKNNLLKIGAQGKYLLVCTGLYFVHLMDSDTLEILHTHKYGGEGVKDMAILESRGVILLSVGGLTQLYPLDLSRPRKALRHSELNDVSIRVSQDEKTVVIGSSNGAAYIYNTIDWELIGTIYNDSRVIDSAFLHDGKVLTIGVDDSIKQWSTTSIPEVDPAIPFKTGRGGEAVYKLGYRADGRKMAISGWDCMTIPLLDVHTNQIDYINVKDFEKTPGYEKFMWFRPQTYELAVQTPGWLRFHDTEQKGYPEVRKISIPNTINKACFDSSGKYMAVSYINRDLALIDIISGQSHKIQLSHNDMKADDLSFSKDGKILAILKRSNHGRLILWDVANSHIAWEIEMTCNGDRSGVAFHPYDDIVAVSSGSTIRVWDIISGNCISTLLGHEHNVSCVQFSPDGTRLISGTTDGGHTMKLWDWKLGKDLLDFKQGYYPIDIKFSPDGLSIASTNIYPNSAWIRTALPWRNPDYHERLHSEKTEDFQDIIRESDACEIWELIRDGRYDGALQQAENLQLLPCQKDFIVTEDMQFVLKRLSQAFSYRAEAEESAEDYTNAITDYKSVLRIFPTHEIILNKLACLQATCLKSEFRNGLMAIENATKACELTNWQDYKYIATLAVAYAETSDFEEAVKWQKEAINLIEPKDFSVLRSNYELQLCRFQLKQEDNGNLHQIPSSAKVFANHHYLLYIDPMNWKAAKIFAESVGGHLATINSDEENKWIQANFDPSLRYWLGGTDEEREGDWKWCTNEDWIYTCWNKAEPNNSNNAGTSVGEHGLQMSDNGKWNDADMAYNLPFLIEWER